MLPFSGLIKSIIIKLMVLVSLLLITLLLMVTTEPGSRWLIQTALSDIKQLRVEEIKGTLMGNLFLKQIHYQDNNGFMISATGFILQWQVKALFKGNLHIKKLHLDTLNIKGQPKTAEDSATSSEIPKIPLPIFVDKLSINQLVWHRKENKSKIQHLVVRAKIEKNTLTISRLELTTSQLKLNASSKIHLQSNWPLTAKLDWSYFPNQTSLHGQLAIRGDMQRFNLKSLITGDIESSQSGYISLTGEQTEFKLQGKWQKLQWPLAGIAEFSSGQGDFYVQGTTQHYQSRLNARVSSADHPDFSIAFSGNGNQDGIDIQHMQLKPAQGQLDLTGQFSWLDGNNFDLALTVQQLNPADLGTDIPGILDIKAHSKGSINNDKINAELTIDKLSGEIHQQPVYATGQLKLLNQQLKIAQLKMSAGRNWITAKGRISEDNIDLDLTIKAQDLSTAWPTLNGNLNGHALIRGSQQSPIIKSKFKGENIRYGAKQIGQLTFNADYEHSSARQSRVDLSARSVQLDDHKIKQFSLQGHGNQSNHRLKLNLSSEWGALDINTQGQWDGKQWQGLIKQLHIKHPQLKRWQLQSPSTLTLTQSRQNYIIDLKNTCLFQANARLCVSAQGSPDTKLEAELVLFDWPLALTKPWLPDDLTLTGNLSAQAQLSFSKRDLTAAVNANISQGLVTIKDTNNIYHKVALSSSTVQLQYLQNQLNCQVDVGLGKQDFVKADVNAGKANATGIRELSGTFQTKINNMQLIDSLLPDIQQLQGSFNADVQLGGNTEHPALSGFAKWQNGKFEIVQLGSSFHDINLQISSSDNPELLLLDGEIKSTQGKLSAQGQLKLLPEHNYPLQINLTGEQFQISRLPEAEVLISPSLTIDKYDNLTRIDGKIKIDQAQIEIKTLPESAVAPSQDEFIISDTEEAQLIKIDPAHVNTHIVIDFGDNTHFSGFGLTTRLSGKLKYIVKKDKQNLQGQAKMRDASYRSYGQDLVIRKGEFLFNGPADNPWLNIEAIRKSINKDVTAVLNVSGPLKAPETRVYTEPALSESEALSYLITGDSLKGISRSNGSAVANAAFNYGAGQLSWLSERLGIDDFEFKQSKKIENSAVKLGHYLNPDLYLGITMGLFSTKYAASIKYRLNDNFSINTRAGESQRIDLKYHIKTD